MSTRSFSHLILAALIAVLFGVLASGALAAKNDNGKSDPGKRSAPATRWGGISNPAPTQDNRSDSQPNASDKGRNYQVDTPAPGRQDSGSQPSWGAKPGNSNKPSVDQPRVDQPRVGQPRVDQPRVGQPRVDQPRVDLPRVDQPSIDRRPPVAPNTGNRGSLAMSDRGSNSTYQRNTPVSPNAGKKSAYFSVNTRIDINRDYRPKGYTPPVNRGGLYYYSSRPNYKPMHYAHWVFNNYDPGFNRRSAYFYFGFFPYLETARIHMAPYITVTYINRPVHIYSDGYYLSRGTNTDLGHALSDIRDAWLNGRADLIGDHVDNRQTIAVLLDGNYDYSLDAGDYAQMTNDAIDQVQTVSFTWQDVRERTNGDYTAFAKHTYRDDSGRTQTVYVSYTLHQIGREYVIVEVGSSDRAMN